MIGVQRRPQVSQHDSVSISAITTQATSSSAVSTMQKVYPMRPESAIENGLRRHEAKPIASAFLAGVGPPFESVARACWTGVVAALFLTACASTPEPRIVTRTVNIPVAIKCAAPLSADPQYADTPESLKAAPDIFAKVQLILAGRAQRNARITELTAAISGCVG